MLTWKWRRLFDENNWVCKLVCIIAQIISTALIRSCWFIAVFIECRMDLHFPWERPDVAVSLWLCFRVVWICCCMRLTSWTPVVRADLMQKLCEVSALLQLSRWFSCETVQSSLKSEICWNLCQFWCYESLVPWLWIGAHNYWVYLIGFWHTRHDLYHHRTTIIEALPAEMDHLSCFFLFLWYSNEWLTQNHTVP